MPIDSKPKAKPPTIKSPKDSNSSTKSKNQTKSPKSTQSKHKNTNNKNKNNKNNHTNNNNNHNNNKYNKNNTNNIDVRPKNLLKGKDIIPLDKPLFADGEIPSFATDAAPMKKIQTTFNSSQFRCIFYFIFYILFLINLD